MEWTGVLVDVKVLGALGASIEEELKKLDAEAKRIVGHDFSVRSRDQLEKILFDDLELPVLKRTPKGGRSDRRSFRPRGKLAEEAREIPARHRELPRARQA